MKKIVVIIHICVLVLFFVACSSIGGGYRETIGPGVIDLNKYICIEYFGNNLAGYASVSIDRERFLLDNIDKISFNKKTNQVYREYYGTANQSAASAILDHISIALDKNYGLSNGDSVEAVWKIDKEKIDTYFVWKYTFTPQVYTVAGLPEADTFDAFESVEIDFEGTAPYGRARVNNFGTFYGGEYEVFPNENLCNGDIVTVRFNCEDKRTMVARYGKYPDSFEKTYTVSGLNTYIQSVDEISAADFEQLVSEARSEIWVSGYGNYRDAKYCGSYFFSAREQEAHGVHFLKWCGMPVGNTICFVFEHPQEMRHGSDSGIAYTVIALENLLMDEKGKLIYKKHEMWKVRYGFESQQEVQETFEGVFDEIMYCTNNVLFD